MPEQFEWVPDLARGEWLRPVEDEPFGSILSVVPRGFEAYARIFHPVERDRPRATKSWYGVDRETFYDGLGVIEDHDDLLETERATWADAAASFNTTLHAEAQYARLVRGDYGDDGGIAADGWSYDSPAEGCLDTLSLAAASEVLARHTTTPDSGVAAIWEGWGGLVSSGGVRYLAVEPMAGWPDDYPDGTAAPLASPSFRDRLAAATRRGLARARYQIRALRRPDLNDPVPGTGLLSPEVASGPHFDLHGDSGRHYILFEAGANSFADPAWPDRAPWIDGNRWSQSPSIIWPDDHSWVLATEIDFDSTLVAGTTELIRELVQTPGLEVFPIRIDADLTWGGDRINHPD